MAAVLSPEVSTAIEAFRHLARRQLAELVFTQDPLLPGDPAAETVESLRFELCCDPVHETLERRVVLEAELTGPARPALCIRTDLERDDINDTGQPPGSHDLLVEPGIEVAERIRLYENAAFIDRSGTTCHQPLFGVAFRLAGGLLLRHLLARGLLALRRFFRRL